MELLFRFDTYFDWGETVLTVFYFFKYGFYFFYLVHPIVIHRVAVGTELTFLIPVANRQGANTDQASDFVNR